jgi:hypothetical protein
MKALLSYTILTAALFGSASASASIPRCSVLFQHPSDGQIHQLIQNALTPGPQQPQARAQLQTALELNELNFVYYMSLFEKYQNEKNRPAGQALVTQLYPAENAKLLAYPIGSKNVPPAIVSEVKTVSYSQLSRTYENQPKSPNNVALVIRKLQAGTGSSMTRQNYYDRRPNMPALLGLPAGTKMNLGAKGTDLLVKISNPRIPGQEVEISIAELQLLQVIQLAKKGQLSSIILQDIVGPETQNRLNAIWDKPSLLDPSLTYAQLYKKTPGLGRLPGIFQSHVPAVNEQGQVSFNRMAPAGHGLFARGVFEDILNPKNMPVAKSQNVVIAIANGEDATLLNGAIPQYMVANKTPIVVVTTTKTTNDRKGGIFTLVKDLTTGQSFLKILETAEAKAAGQLTQFENSDGILNTNLALFNYQVLSQKLERIPKADLSKVLAPDLINNWKEQKDKDGVLRKYLQLEGAMGSVIMNLDRYYRNNFNESLVTIVNVEADHRTELFSPIKAPIDFWLQFHSDRFQIDPKDYTIRLVGQGLPSFSLKDPTTKEAFYGDVQNVLDSFHNTSVLDLNDLKVTGQVNASNVALKGQVILLNETNKPVNLRDAVGTIAENIQIRWTAAGAVEITSLRANTSQEPDTK